MNTYILRMYGFSTEKLWNGQMAYIEVKAYDEDEAVKNLGNRAIVLNDHLCDQWWVMEVTEKE